MTKGLCWEWNRLFRTDWSSWTVLTNNVKHLGFHIHCKQYLSLSRFSGKLHARTSAAFPVLCLQSRVWSFHCLVPRRLSFDENVRAKEGGKETTGDCTLPMVPCGSSLVTRFALASRKTRHLRRRLINSLSYWSVTLITVPSDTHQLALQICRLSKVRTGCHRRLAVRVIFGIK